MKLPELTPQQIGALTANRATGGISAYELAQLHCLRSIGVNLELLVGIQGLEILSTDVYQTTLNVSEDHSVADLFKEEGEDDA